MGPNTKVKEKQSEGTSTQQLLADLTDDFEEAITAQICLSNQLLDANLNTVESTKEDILILKNSETTASAAVVNNKLPMELDNTSTTTNEIITELKTKDVVVTEDEVAATTTAAAAADIDNRSSIYVVKTTVDTTTVISATVGSTAVCTRTVDTTTDTSTVNTTTADTATVDTTTVDTTIVDTTKADATKVDTKAVDTTAVDTTAVDTTVVDTTAVDTTVVDTTAVDTTAVDTTIVDTTIVDTTITDTTIADTSIVNTTIVDTTIVDTTIVDTTIVDNTIVYTTTDDKKNINLANAASINEAIKEAEAASSGMSEEASEPLAASSTLSTKQDAARPTIVAMEELPPIRTDSTMTASEVEDNIEERLSQLDGTATVQPVSVGAGEEVETSVLDVITTQPRSHTPTAASTQAEEHQQQQQLQKTPPTSQQQHNFTPQSSSSSVNTIGSGSTHIPKDFMKDTSAGELEDQDIEEVLKALKGLDSSTAADTICDLNVLFNEVYTTLNYEEINSQHNSSACGSRTANPLKDIQADIEKKQQSMQRKIDFLLRRLRKIQARYMCKHTSEEISGLFEWSARTVSKTAKLSHEDDVTERQQLNYAEQKSHPVTSVQLSSMLRKIEMVANAQQLTTSTSSSTTVSNLGKRKPYVKKSMALFNSTQEVSASTAANAENNKSNTLTVVPNFDTKITEEIGHVTGLLQSEMHEIQNAIDSDATESSSGGESADEMVTYNNQMQQSLQIAKRAAWRYSRDRAAIAARWSWLLSQISDLEIKIRQHSELHQELIRAKGPAIVGLDSSSAAATTTTSNSTPYNGYKAAQPLPQIDEKDNYEDEESSCCRTRGILASNFRKRKLFQTANIHTFSKKAARPSTIKCGCQWPLLPCALCTGRADPTSPRDLPDTMMMADRVALLDPGYHPVLSFPGDISNSIHFEAICRLPEWQQRVLRCPVKNIAKSLWRAEREALHASMGGKKNSDAAKRKYIKKKDLIREQQQQLNNGNGTGTLSMSSTPLVANKKNNSAAMTKIIPARINNNSLINNHHHQYPTSDYHQQNYAQYNPSQAHSSSISSTVRNNKNRKLSSSAAATAAAAATNSNFHYNHQHSSNDNNCSNSEFNYLHSDSWDSQVTRSRTSSPTHSGSKKNKSLDRRNRTSYDIDNIVIPYSVAAATRVELLPYKEIPTPKWRVIEESNEVPPEMFNSKSCDESSSSANLKKVLPQSVGYYNKTQIKTVVCDSLNLSAKARISEAEQKQAAKNIIDVPAERTNNQVNTADEENADSNTTNKCRLNQKRTYSEKENTVDPIDAFDKIKDSDAVNSLTANEAGSSESIAKKAKISGDIKGQQRVATNEDLRLTKATNNLNNLAKKKENAEANANKNNSNEDIDEDGTEDVTDEAMVIRHERALVEERQRLKFPWSTRSRANRRIDSRVDWSSGANTPDPASPATNTPSGDLDSIPSPAAPSTPLNLLDNIAESGETTTAISSGINANSTIAPPPLSWQNCYNKRYERRRTTSAKTNKEQQERRSTSPDSKELIPPYEPRKFPISDEVFDNMLKIDKILQANSMMFPHPENSLKNEINAKRSNHKSNTINSSINSNNNREIAPVCDDSETEGFNEVDDDYSPHHLAVADDDYPDAYDAASYPRHKLVGVESDIDTSEADPFSDDDPNDPEWKGETEEKDKIRRKL